MELCYKPKFCSDFMFVFLFIPKNSPLNINFGSVDKCVNQHFEYVTLQLSSKMQDNLLLWILFVETCQKLNKTNLQ